MGRDSHKGTKTSPSSHESKGNQKNSKNSSSIKELCKSYKNLLLKKKISLDKHLSSNKYKDDSKFKDNVEPCKYDEESPATSGRFNDGAHHERKHSKDDSFLSRTASSLLSRTTSRRSHTPTPTMQRSTSQRSSKFTMRSMSRRSKTPAPATPVPSFEPPALSKIMSTGRTTTTTTTPPPGIQRTMSRRSTTPIVFSRSSPRKKPAPVEKRLECTLEELCFGAVKVIKFTRDVITDLGIIVQKEETLKIDVKPGWRKGTKITFEGIGDEKPGFLPADIVFMIEEKKHLVYKRIGDDIELAVEVPLVKGLTGCTISLPLLGGERVTMKIDDVIHPAFEKVIDGQGMKKAVEAGRGSLRLKFLVRFPTKLSEEQRSEISAILRDFME